jgi:hypothetical protein
MVAGTGLHDARRPNPSSNTILPGAAGRIISSEMVHEGVRYE